ncbi:hypothetical protein ACFQ08_15490 [Streptosporangium algeriense]|uniref:Septum formation initiator n=1 Tax=Streptosporangium algeriense TaxID=1682748 RepID=A0ABW3DT37_9ACTN
MKRRSVAGVLGWVAAACATTATTTWAITLLGQGLSQQVVSPMSHAQITQELALATAAGETGGPVSPTEGAGGVSRAFSTPGGSVVGTCAAGRASLLAWSPAQGYATDDVSEGPGPHAWLEFESEDNKITVKVTCVRGVPSMTLKEDRDND